MYADSMLSHHKHGLPVENSTGTSEYLRLVNNKVGAGSILRVKTVTSGYSLQPQHFHLVDSDVKYLYDVEVMIKMRHSDAYTKLQEIMTDFPITCLLQRIELQKLLLDIVGSAVMLPNATVNGHIDHSDGNSSGHVTPLLAMKSLVAMFKKAAQHLANEMAGDLSTALPVCSADGTCSSVGSEQDQAVARMAEDNKALVYAIYKLRYPVYFSSYHALPSIDKGAAAVANSKVFNIHSKSTYFPSLPGYAFAICAATVKLLKMKHSCPGVFTEAGSGAGVSSRELVLAVYSSVARDVLPFVLEPTSLQHTSEHPVPLSKVEADRAQYLLSATNEVIGYHGVEELLRGCFLPDVSSDGSVALVVIRYVAALLASVPVDRANHVDVRAAASGRSSAERSDPATMLDLYYDEFVVALLRRLCASVTLRRLLAAERRPCGSGSVMEALDRLLLTLDPDFSAGVARAQSVVAAFQTVQFFVHDDEEIAAGGGGRGVAACVQLAALRADDPAVGSLPNLLALYELVVRRVWLVCDFLEQKGIVIQEDGASRLEEQLLRDLGVAVGCLTMIGATLDSVCIADNEGAGSFSMPAANAALLPGSRAPTCCDVMLVIAGRTLALTPSAAQRGTVEAMMSLCPSLGCGNMTPQSAVDMSRVASRYNFDLPSAGDAEEFAPEPDTFDLLFANASPRQVLLLAECLLTGCLREYGRLAGTGTDAGHLAHMTALCCKVLQFYYFQFLMPDGQLPTTRAQLASAETAAFIGLLPMLLALHSVVLTTNLELLLPSPSDTEEAASLPVTLVVSQCVDSIEDLCLSGASGCSEAWAEFYYRCVGLELFSAVGMGGPDAGRDTIRAMRANRDRYIFRIVHQLLRHSGESTVDLDEAFSVRLCGGSEGAGVYEERGCGAVRSGTVFTPDKLHALSSIAFCAQIRAAGGAGVDYSLQERGQALFQLRFLLSGANPGCRGLLRKASPAWCVNVFRYCVESVRGSDGDEEDATGAASNLINTLLLAELLLRELSCVRDCCSVKPAQGTVDISPLFALVLLPSPAIAANDTGHIARFLAARCVQLHCIGALQPTDGSGALAIPERYRCIHGNLALAVPAAGKPSSVSETFNEAVCSLPVLCVAAGAVTGEPASPKDTCAGDLVLALLGQHEGAANDPHYFVNQLRSICAFVKNPSANSDQSARPALGVIQQLIENLQQLHALVTIYPSTMVPLIFCTTVTEPVDDPSRLLLLDSLRVVLSTVPVYQVSANAVNDNIILNTVLALLTAVVQYTNTHALEVTGPRASLCKGVELFCAEVFGCLVHTLLPVKCAQILAGGPVATAAQPTSSGMGHSSVNTSIPYDSHDNLSDSNSYYSSSSGVKGTPAVTGRQLGTRRPTNVTLEKRVVNEELVRVYGEGLRLTQTRCLQLLAELVGDSINAGPTARSAQSVIGATEEVRIPGVVAGLFDRWLRGQLDAVVAGDTQTVSSRCMITKLAQIVVSERVSAATRDLAAVCLHRMCAASAGLVWTFLIECDHDAEPITHTTAPPAVLGATWTVQMLVRTAKRLRLPDSVRGSAVARWCLMLLIHYSSSGPGPSRFARVAGILTSCVVPARGDTDAEAEAAAAGPHCDILLLPSPDSGSGACGVYCPVELDWTWLIHLLHSRLNATKCLALELVYNVCSHCMYHRGRMGGAPASDSESGGRCSSIPWNLLTTVQNCVTSNVTSIATPHVECSAVRTVVLRIMYAVFQHPTASTRVLDFPMSMHDDTDRTRFDSGVCTMLAQICAAVGVEPSGVHADAPVLRTGMQDLKTHVDLLLHIVVTQCALPGDGASRVLATCKDLKLFARLVGVLSDSFFSTYLEQVKAKLLRNMYARPAEAATAPGLGHWTGAGAGVDETGWDRAFGQFAATESRLYVQACTATVRLFQFLCSAGAHTRGTYTDCVCHSALFANTLTGIRALQEAAARDNACVDRDWLLLCTLQFDLVCATATLLLGPGGATSASSAQMLETLRLSAPALLELISYSVCQASELLAELLVAVCRRGNEDSGVCALFTACATLSTSCLRLLTTITGLCAQCPQPALQSCFLSLLMLRRCLSHFASSVVARGSDLSMDASIFSGVASLVAAIPVVQGALQLQISVSLSSLLQRCSVFPAIKDYSFGIDTAVVARTEELHPKLVAGLLLARNLECSLMPPIASATALVGEISHAVLRESLDSVFVGVESLVDAGADATSDEDDLSSTPPANAGAGGTTAADTATSPAVNKKQLSLLKSKVPLHKRGIRSPSKPWDQTATSNSTTIPRAHSSSFARPAVCYSRAQLRRTGSSAQVAPPMVTGSTNTSATTTSSPSSVSDALSPADLPRTGKASRSQHTHSSVGSAQGRRRLYADLLVLQSILPLASPDMKDLVCTPQLVYALHQLILISRTWGLVASGGLNATCSGGRASTGEWSPTPAVLFTAVCATVAAVLHRNPTMKSIVGTLPCGAAGNRALGDFHADRTSPLFLHHLLGAATNASKDLRVHPFVKRFYLALVHSIVGTGSVVGISQKSALSLGVIQHLHRNMRENTHGRLQPECVLLFLDALTAMVCNSSEYTNGSAFGTQPQGQTGTGDTASIVSTSTYGSYNRVTKMKQRNSPRPADQSVCSATSVEQFLRTSTGSGSGSGQGGGSASSFVPLPELLDMILESYLEPGASAASSVVNNFLVTTAVLKSIGKIALTSALTGNKRMLTVATHEKCLGILLQGGWIDSLRVLLRCASTEGGVGASDVLYYGSTCLMTALTAVWLLINNSESARSSVKKTLGLYDYKLLYRHMNTVILHLNALDVSDRVRCADVAEVISRAWISIYQLIQ